MLSIMVVDDEDDIRRLLTLWLESNGHTVINASGGNQAIELLQMNTVDLIISDVQMPKGHGIDLLKNVRDINSQRPIICLMSGFTKVTEAEVKDMGGDMLLTKPLDLQELNKFINQVKK